MRQVPYISVPCVKDHFVWYWDHLSLYGHMEHKETQGQVLIIKELLYYLVFIRKRNVLLIRLNILLSFSYSFVVCLSMLAVWVGSNLWFSSEQALLLVCFNLHKGFEHSILNARMIWEIDSILDLTSIIGSETLHFKNEKDQIKWQVIK